MPALPPQLYDVSTSETTIYLHDNQLSGPFPWESLNAVAFFSINNNEFTGDIKLPSNYEHFRVINISSNNFHGMVPCMMDNHTLEFLDARFNKFDSIATDRDDECFAWPKRLQQLFLSDNQIKAKLDKAVRNLTNLFAIEPYKVSYRS